MGVEVRVTAEGRVVLPSVGLDLIAVGLTSEEARGIALLLAAADEVADEPIPAPSEPARAWEAHSNAAGQLVDDRVGDRGEPDVAGATLLPEPDDAYLAAAVTVDDLAALAPVVPDDVRQEVEDADPNLDADVAEWLAKSGDRPRLSVLGPVAARVGRGGNPLLVSKRRPFFTELLAYLATRTGGASVAQVAEAMAITPDRARRDMSTLRVWLGEDPKTGEKYIPPALESESSHLFGGGRYEVNRLLVDADLFRRLRVRGEARGADGLSDLKTALTLVSGQPFDQIRSTGGTWLVDDGLAHHLTCAIVDVAHLVCTVSLARNDRRTARAAAELALLAAPHEEIPRLDLAAVATAEGMHHEADRIIRALVEGDGQEPPVELTDRAHAILSRHAWLREAKVG